MNYIGEEFSLAKKEMQALYSFYNNADWSSFFRRNVKIARSTLGFRLSIILFFTILSLSFYRLFGGEKDCRHDASCLSVDIQQAAAETDDPIKVTIEHVQERLPHDPGAFVQGLFYQDGVFIESTGGYGGSSLRRVELETGKVMSIHRLPPYVFAEGCAPIPDGRIVQLTWRNRIAYVYDSTSLRPIAVLPYPREGWGLVFDGCRLLASDGSHRLYWLDPEGLETLAYIEVRKKDGSRLSRINEMALVEGKILANIFPTNYIVRINPRSGLVERKWDLSAIAELEKTTDPEHVLNGIAYDASTGRLWFTGKCWEYLYRVELPE